MAKYKPKHKNFYVGLWVSQYFSIFKPCPKPVLHVKSGPGEVVISLRADDQTSTKDSFSSFKHLIGKQRLVPGIKRYQPCLAESKTGPSFENQTWEGETCPQ